MKKAKIKPHLKKTELKVIPKESDRLKEYIIFSFKYLDFTNKKFQFPKDKPDYFVAMIERFQSICCLTLNQFRVNCSESIHSHPINWKCTVKFFSLFLSKLLIYL